MIRRYPPLLYMLAAVVAGLLFFMLYRRFGFGLLFFQNGFLIVLLVIASLVDGRRQIIPNPIIVCGLCGALFFNGLLCVNRQDFSALLDMGLGVVAGGLPILLVILVSRGGMGMGDLKLLAMIGAYLGPRNVLESFALSILLGGAVGAVLLLFKVLHRKSKIAFGPFLSVGAMIMIFFADQIHVFMAVIYHVPMP